MTAWALECDSLETVLFLLNSIGIVLLVFMGLRDDRRPPGTPQTSLFRYTDGPEAQAKAASESLWASFRRPPTR